MTAPNKLSSALALAKRGFRVFPLGPNSKVPAEKVSINFPVIATTDPEKIKTWWGQCADFNIGISTNGLLAVDVDVKSKDKNGLDTIERLLKVGKVLPPTTTQTTTTGGMHFIYATPQGVSNSASKLGPGLDIRGDGGYLVAAGSTVNGKTYQIDSRSLNTAPQWLVESCGLAREEKPQAHLKIEGVNEERAKERGSKYLSELLPITEGSRNQDAYRVAAILKDFGLEKQDTFLLMMDEWKCEPALELDELKAVVTSAYRYGKEAQGSAAPEAMFGKPGTEEDKGRHPFEILNGEYAFVMMGSSHRIIQETTDEEGTPVIFHLNEDSFHKKLAARKLQTSDAESKPLTKAWISSTARRTYEGIVFAPGMKIDPRFYNLWRGFSIDPIALNEPPTEVMIEAVKKFEEHLFVNVCESNTEYYEWVYTWFAHIIQRPWEKIGVALVMKGRKGVGKNILLDTVGNLFSNNYMVTANKRYLTSQFNSHMENLLLMVLDEAFWSGSKEDHGILKNLITAPEITIERKGFDSYDAKSRLRIAIIGNESWIVPASEDERRYAVFNVGESRMQDTDFFTALREGMEAGGYRYLLRKFLDWDISKINLRKAPQTEGLREQKEESLSAFQKLWRDYLIQGYVPGLGFEEGQWITKVNLTELSDRMHGELKTKGNSLWKWNIRDFEIELKEVLPGVKIFRTSNVLTLEIPSLKICRELWDKKMGAPSKWIE